VTAVAACLNVVIQKRSCIITSPDVFLESEQGLRNKKREKYERVPIKIHAVDN
jgi:hypothetical protein